LPKERVDKQYYTDFNLTKKEVEDAVKKAESFGSFLFDFISKLNNEKIKGYREKFKSIIFD